MCSSTLGPAMEPSLLTWPMTKTVMPSPLASCISAMVQSFTWLTLPAGESSASLYSVWMESTISTSGRSRRTDSSTSPKFVSEMTNRLGFSTRKRLARSFNWCSDSSPDTYSTLENSQSLLQICSISVDLPMPGAPPTSTSEPLTAPPPRTRSNSPMPVGNRISSSAFSSVTGQARRIPCPARTVFPALFKMAFVASGCSTMVFQAPQAGHFPAHFAVSLPHSVQ